MATSRVIAYCMHESELADATQAMQPIQVTESFVVGDADEAAIAQMRARGLIVEVVGNVARDNDAVTRAIQARRFSRAAAIGGALPIGIPPPPPPAPGASDYYQVSIDGPMLDDWRAQLEARGAQIIERAPDGSTKVRLQANEVANVANLPFVKQVRGIDGEDAAPKFVREPRAASDIAATGRRMLTFDIRLNQPADAPVVMGWLADNRIAVAGNNDRKIRVFVMENDPLLDAIPALSGVASFEQYIAPRLFNDVARRLLSIDANPAGPMLAQTGDGQIVGVADTGIDVDHPDFAGRIHGKVALGRPTFDDPHGHGTHVAGSVLGDGNASAGKYKGTAPGAKLFFQSLLDPQGGLGGLPFDLGDLFEEAWINGARVHNNSWGSATASRYTMSSSEVDEFVARRRDMLIVIAAGNEGVETPRVNSATGFVDWLSIGSPASSKNALTVGASRSDRTSGGYAQRTYGANWPASFANNPIMSETVSGDPQALAAFSSRGPCDDHRIKPDLVAPGTDIASTKSALAPLRNFWGPIDARYAYMGGTSMAAPLVSGCAALVREYYVKTRNHEPSAALVKATLINGTDWLTGADACAAHQGRPNYHQGFGRVSMTNALPNTTNASLKLEFSDDWEPAGVGFTVTGQRRRWNVIVAPGATTLRICLAYTDAPARGLQNNLNLFVQLPDNSKVIGNAQLPNSLNIPDPDNNVEIVRFDNPAPGQYLVQITASNLLKPPQDFALVVVSDGLTAFTPT